jgi:aquaporin Z
MLESYKDIREVSMFGRQKIAALVAEFVGTAVLASAVLAMAGRTSFPFFAAVTAGSVMALMVMIIGSISGAHINPAVTVGLWTLRQIKTTQAIVYIAAQMLGGIAAWQFNEFLLDQPLRNTASGNLDWRILAAEAFGAFVFGIAVAAASSKAYDTAKTAVTVGIGLTAGIVVSSIASNGIINPAVAAGIQSWDWSYALGPIAGAILGMNVYGLVLAPAQAVARPVAKTSAKPKAATTKKAAKKPAKSTTRKKK